MATLIGQVGRIVSDIESEKETRRRTTRYIFKEVKRFETVMLKLEALERKDERRDKEDDRRKTERKALIAQGVALAGIAGKLLSDYFTKR